ncbi:Gfo/Idh/MocA family oxidoreductase [Allonocardiopsis opalescens]
MYTSALAGSHAAHGTAAAFCDTNLTRMRAHNALLREQGAAEVPAYGPDRFAEMLDKEDVHEVIVCSVDRTHAHYIAAALDAGRDVITEKPMTSDLAGCRQVLDAQRRTGGRVRVAFNYRYNPVHAKVRELLAAGAIGEVGSVHFEWLLDLSHGADYFRRWHRDRANSGGLLVHKSSHHFDLVNWWLGAEPESVFGWGRLFFYGDDNGRRRGLARGYDRAHADDRAADDPFALRIADDPVLRSLYLDAEHEDGYHRDQNVFAPGITVEDDMSLLVRYGSGTALSYHLAAYSPWEGYRVAFTGSGGRLELDVLERDHVAWDSNAPGPKDTTSRLTLQRHWEPAEEVPVTIGEGGHGGGDRLLLDALFAGTGVPAPDHTDGARALLCGLAANRSFETGLPVETGGLL